MFQESSVREVSVSNVNVDNKDIISAQISIANEGQFLPYLFVSTSNYDDIHTMDTS